jgi:hypothetical protein
MATTTNYGWTTPDDTALVKDGAAAIRTLGTSVDTTTKALNPSTTLGDIEYRSSSANTNTRLGIGSTGDVLTVTGGVPVWAAPAAPGTPAFVGCMLYSSTGQVIANNTITAVAFSDTDYIDTDAFHDPSVNNTRITIPAGKGGKYLVITGGLWATAPEQIRSIIYVNGTNFTELRDFENGGRSGPIGHDILSLTAGDYIEFFTLQTSGGNNTLWGTTDMSGVKATRFGVEFLGA